jgi:hypothetical protein
MLNEMAWTLLRIERILKRDVMRGEVRQQL